MGFRILKVYAGVRLMQTYTNPEQNQMRKAEGSPDARAKPNCMLSLT